ncbi:hypothetical protein AB4Z09_07155 [Rhodococcus sp. TAF43]|uniref:hypothetical protein n=1 Tax=Rhodococcus sp. TAF43 TaxID=3237483 RepID=UPI003F9DFA5A
MTNNITSPKALSLLLAAGAVAAGVVGAAGTASAAPTPSVTKTVVIGLDGTMTTSRTRTPPTCIG